MNFDVHDCEVFWLVLGLVSVGLIVKLVGTENSGDNHFAHDVLLIRNVANASLPLPPVYHTFASLSTGLFSLPTN